MNFSGVFLLSFFLLLSGFLKAQMPIKELDKGVYFLSAGAEDRHTPLSFKERSQSEMLKKLPEAGFPFDKEDIKIIVTSRGCIVEIPLENNEQLYGFGLQIGSFNQRGLKKRPIVNDHPLNDLGYTHAPQPYYVSSKGYAILINTARYTTFYMGTNKKNINAQVTDKESQDVKLSTDQLYISSKNGNDLKVQIDVPGARGVGVLVFAGPGILNAVQRYNLFSGGGSLPAIWGMGVKYRVKADSKQEDVYRMAKYFRSKQIPVDVIGLEPKWQTRAYSCSYVWNTEFFPNPKKMIGDLKNEGFRVNLWEHAFVHPTSPLHQELESLSGDHLVWNGLVPDFVNDSVRNIFGNYHHHNFIQEGISGFKLDECDNSNITRGDLNWSFPELSRFPSGVDGEQMHQLFGFLYQKTINDEYRKHDLRTYTDVRSLGPFASPYPSSIYSDIYGYADYIQMISNAGISGLLWSPEVRESASRNEFFRRSQVAILSAQTLFNCWYLKNAPWLQFDIKKNNKDSLLEDAEANEIVIRKLLNFRMSLVPYLYATFEKYRSEGLPPFRPLIMNYPQDKKVINIWDQYLIGNDLLVCPVMGEGSEREVYLPEGDWYDFNSNKKYTGGQSYTVNFSIDEIPLFIRSGSIIPFAKPVQYISKETIFDITCHVYGDEPRSFELFEDDGVSYQYEQNRFNAVLLSYDKKGKAKRTGNYKGKRYNIIGWKKIN